MKNAYSYQVIKNDPNNAPLHVVTIRAAVLAAVAVFSNARDAVDYIDAVRGSATGLVYDDSLTAPAGLIQEYRRAARLFSRLDNRQVYIAY